MAKILTLLTLLAMGMTDAHPSWAETITFEARDGVTVTADVTRPAAPADTAILLFHMAGASRGEYRDIAPRLVAKGYVVVAVDQRSGGRFNNVTNETAARVGRDPGFRAASPDLLAASEWARANLGVTRIGALGSSYSASLVLILAGEHPNFADAVMSFSPGEYFPNRKLVREAAAGLQVPAFLTSARAEVGQWAPIEAEITSPVTGYRPAGSGRHGASVLVSADAAEYWTALEGFLDTHLPAE